MANFLLTFSVIGLFLSLYAVRVEQEASIDPNYEALCDLNETVSCTKVFTSEQGKLFSYFGLVQHGSVFDKPNAEYGIMFYFLVMLLDFEITYRKNTKKFAAILLVMVSLAGCMTSAYLAYVLQYVLHDFCIVCVSTYVCNAVIFGGALHRYWSLSSAVKRD